MEKNLSAASEGFDISRVVRQNGDDLLG